MIKSAFIDLTILLIISCAVTGQEFFKQNTKNGVHDDDFRYHEEFFNKIRNTKMKYSFKKNPSYKGYYYSFSTVSCFDHKNQTRECTTATVNYDSGSFINFCNHSIQISNYQAKETEVSTFAYNGIILTTLLKSKEIGIVFLDIIYAKPDAYTNCKKFNHQRIEVGESMWNNNKNPIILQTDYDLYEIFYESRDGSTILKTTITTGIVYETFKMFPQYSWQDVDEIYSLPSYFKKIPTHDKKEESSYEFIQLGYTVLTKNFSELNCYNFDTNRKLDFYGKLSLNDDHALNVEDFQIYGDGDEWVVSLTSFKEQKSQLLLIDWRSMTITKNKLVNLEPNVFKVRFPYSQEHKVHFFQSQCQFETKRCRILHQFVDLESGLIANNKVVAEINATDCMITDFYLKFHEKIQSGKPNTIMYICKKHVSFGSENSIDYLFLRNAYPLNGPIVHTHEFSLNLNFLGDSKILEFHESEYKKLLKTAD